MKSPLLYTYRRCPYAMRARMALLQAEIAFDAHEIVLRDKPAALLALSPKGTVPVLVLPDGTVIEESLEIMRWAFEGRDHDGWWGRAQTPDNQALIALNDGEFKQQLDRYKYADRAQADPAVPRDRAMECMVLPLEQRLVNAASLGGDQPCAADLAIFPFVRQFRGVDAQWFDAQGSLSATRQWLQAWVEGELFERCMKKLVDGGR